MILNITLQSIVIVKTKWIVFLIPTYNNFTSEHEDHFKNKHQKMYEHKQHNITFCDIKKCVISQLLRVTAIKFPYVARASGEIKWWSGALPLV